MSKLPLNVPFLLSRLCPNAKYVMNGRSYGDIVWMDNEVRQPSLQEVENEFLRIQALEEMIEDKAAKIVRLEKINSHDAIEHAKARAKQELALVDAELQAELTKIRAHAAAEIESHKKRVLEEQKKADEAVTKILEEEKSNFLMEIAKSDPSDHFSVITKAVDGAKQSAIASYKYAKKYLESTDWYVMRKTECGVDIPADVLKQRADARATINEIVATVSASNMDIKEWKAKRIALQPSKQDIISALKMGGFAAKEMVKKIKSAQEKAPKPKKRDAWR